MGLSDELTRAHIDNWTRKFELSNRPYKANWPSKLFRHEPLESVLRILQSGVLLSRNDAGARIATDIAPPQIIQRSSRAHGYVRLYFRPKSPTQFHVEGIRKPGEEFHGCQAAVLIILVFDSFEILTSREVRFSDGNMQSPWTKEGSTDADFQTLLFDRIYHEGSFDSGSPQGDDIVRSRCAEVLLPSPLELTGTLRGILCRSPAERSTLIHLLGEHAAHWRERVRVFREPGLFENRYAYLYSVDADSNGVVLKIHPRSDGRPVTTQMWIYDEVGNLVAHRPARDLDPKKVWRAKETFRTGSYLARIELENRLAHEAPFVIDDIPF